MDDSNNTMKTFEQADEDIFASTLSDETLEAAAGAERAARLPSTVILTFVVDNLASGYGRSDQSYPSTAYCC